MRTLHVDTNRNRVRWALLVGLAVPVAGCAAESATSSVEPGDRLGATEAHADSPAPSTAPVPRDSAELPSALRAAVIAATQREADASYAARRIASDLGRRV